MERLTAKCLKGSGYYMACSKTCPYDCMEDCDCEEFDNFVNRLGAIEDMCAEYDLDRLRELAQADREGRIVLRSAGAGKQCGSCGHWHRIRDTRRGTCDVRQWLRDRYGASNPGASFTPAQSYGACRDYIPGEGRGNG